MDGAGISDAVISVWRDRLRRLIGLYEAYRERTGAFWRILFVAFFCLNVVCYQIAIMTAFPDRAFGSDWLRYAFITIPVGILGAAFDCASFVVTLAIMRHAIRAKGKLIYLGHIAADIMVAVLATAWVLIVFAISTALVDFVLGPAAAPLATPPPVISGAPTPTSPGSPTAAGAASKAAPPKMLIETPSPERSIKHAEFLANRAQGYGRRFAGAIDDPFSTRNLQNIYFGVVMGGSAMLPSLVHLYLGLASLLAVAFGAVPRNGGKFSN